MELKGPVVEVPGRIDEVAVLTPEAASLRAKRHSRKRLALAFAVAAISDFLAFWTELLPPVEWALDLATAFLLFLILGRRWAILPGLIAEAVPGMAVFPVWVLVVLSIIVYDEVLQPRRS